MITLILSALSGLSLAALCHFTDFFGPVGCIVSGVLGFLACQMGVGFAFQRKVKAAMNEVQAVLVAGQKQLQAKVARWQMRPPGSIQAAQAEMARDQKVFVHEALARTEALHRFDLWVPMMRRQIATAQFQLHWMAGEFATCDELMPKALFVDSTSLAMKMARLQMKDAPLADIEKVYRKAVRRARYNGNVLAAAAWSWILVRRGDADAAFKALNEALRNSDDATLKANRDHLANNRVAHFSNAGLGEQWYALQLEQPKIRQQRQRMQWR